MKKLNERQKAKLIDQGIRLAWESLSSHLPYTHSDEESLIRDETQEFHKKCVQDYASIISIFTKLY